MEAARLKARSGVPHTIVYRRGVCCDEYELPNYDNEAEAEAEVHWQRHLQHLQTFPEEFKNNKHLVWIENINEPDKERPEWLAKFSFHTALKAMAAGYSYAAFSWASGTPEPYAWEGPEMENFLRVAAQYPDRIAIALHEYDYWHPTLRDSYPSFVGRFERLFEVCDAKGISRPTVLITEFGWPGIPPAEEMMQADNVPWADGLYAGYPQVKGAALWDPRGDMSEHVAALTTYSLQNYFAIPRE
ncbi:MAG: hypothetical protein A2W09_08450 [Deltaproteobacteria bacterium RBG_16_50_11]|nr:MAG: hypothetical protein A2W09_08450 [Deltaproteobacteria bacterium RBG_16_50_11]